MPTTPLPLDSWSQEFTLPDNQTIIVDLIEVEVQMEELHDEKESVWIGRMKAWIGERFHIELADSQVSTLMQHCRRLYNDQKKTFDEQWKSASGIGSTPSQ